MYEAELAFAKQLAQQAGAIMRKYAMPGIAVEDKEDSSPVTAADKAVNDLVIRVVAENYPSHGVLGEEASNFNGEKFVWVCDPIDGTVAYIHRIPTSMFSLALVEDGVPIVAVAYNPWTNELFSAQKGGGAYCNEDAISVSGNDFNHATIGVSGTLSLDKISFAENIRKNIPSTAHVNAATGAVFLATRVAAGDIDGYIFSYNGAHDMAASQLIVREAGGTCTDLAGNEQRYDQPINGAVASNGVIHQQLLALV